VNASQLEKGEARLIMDLTPHVKALNDSGGQLTIQKVGRYRLYPDEQVQAYVRQLGNKLIPEYQRSMAPGAREGPSQLCIRETCGWRTGFPNRSAQSSHAADIKSTCVPRGR
jgi:hypothetical protein